MRERVDAADLRRWRDATREPPLVPGAWSRGMLLADLVRRVKALAVREPGGRGDGFGSLDLNDVVSPTYGELWTNAPWLCLPAGNRFTSAAYGLDAFAWWGAKDNRSVREVDQGVLDDMHDVLLDVVLPLCIAGHTLREAVRAQVRALAPGGVPTSVTTALKDAFKRDDALLRAVLRPALWRRENLDLLEADVLRAARAFTALASDAGDAPEGEPPVGPGPDGPVAPPDEVTLVFAGNVLSVLDRFAATPAHDPAGHAAAAELAAAVRRTWPAADRGPGRREARGGDAMGRVRPLEGLARVVRDGVVGADGEFVDTAAVVGPPAEARTLEAADAAEQRATAGPEDARAVVRAALDWLEEQPATPVARAGAAVLRAAVDHWAPGGGTWIAFVERHHRAPGGPGAAPGAGPGNDEVELEDVLELTVTALEHAVLDAAGGTDEDEPRRDEQRRGR